MISQASDCSTLSQIACRCLPLGNLNKVKIKVMFYDSQEEYECAMSAQAEAEAEYMNQLASDIHDQIEILQHQKEEIEDQIAELQSKLP